MKLAKYFWNIKDVAIRETEKILKNPGHPQFAQRMVALLSRCDKPRDLFSVISKKEFVDHWPKIRTYWIKRMRRSDYRDWWETIYEELLMQLYQKPHKPKGTSAAFFAWLGQTIKEARIAKGLSQRQLAFVTSMKQPDISNIEEGKKNITIFTLLRLCTILGIKKLEIESPTKKS